MGDYNWKNDVMAVAGVDRTDENKLDLDQESIDEIIWDAARVEYENMDMQEQSSWADDTEAMEDISSEFNSEYGDATLWAIFKDSKLYGLLTEWYGTTDLPRRMQNGFEDASFVYFTSGSNQSMEDGLFKGEYIPGEGFDTFTDECS